MRPALSATLLLAAARAVSAAGPGPEAAIRAAEVRSDVAWPAVDPTFSRSGEVRTVQVELEERR